MSQHARILTCITLILLAFCGRALGFSGGITGYSGNPASSGSGAYCSLCHNTGVIPVVAISGSQNVAPGTTSTYSFTINDSPQLIGGLNVSASAGTLQLRPADQSLKKIGQELTHAQPATITGALTWQFDWLAPSTPGTYTLYAAGVIADGDQSAAGDNAAIDSFTVTVAPSGPMPIPVISAPLTAIPGQSITLDGSASTAPVGATLNRYDWTIDGTEFPNTGPVFPTSFASKGWHRAALTVTDSNNVSATTFVDVVVDDSLIPEVDPGGPYSGEAGVAINFDAAGSTSDSSTALINYIWDFGDGSAVVQGGSPNTSHIYAVEGNYTVTVAAQDGNGMTGVAATGVTVTISAPQPTTGEEIYNLQCGACHGPAGSGTVAIPRIIEGATQTQILDAIANVPEMSGLTTSAGDAQLVADYLAIAGTSGEALYKSRCQICHGVDGVGIVGIAPQVRGSTRVMILDKIVSIPSMNAITLDSAESQLIADFLGTTGATTGSGIYAAKCAICHGNSGTGIGGVGPAVKGATQSMIIDAISVYPIMNGIILPNSDAQLVADYLGSGGTTGQDFYLNKCEICHGDSGIGGSAPFVKGATRYMILGEVSRVNEMKGILISSQQSQQIADYLGSGGSTGQDFYVNRCLICHGQDGNGDSGPYNGGGIRGESSSEYLKAIDEKKEMDGILLNSSEAQAIQNYLNGGGG